MKPILFFLYLGFSILPWDIVDAEDDVKMRELTFTTLKIGRKFSVEDLYFDSSPGKSVRLEFGKYERSRKFDYLGPEDFVLYRLGVDDEGNQIKIPVKTLTWMDSEDVLLVFVPKSFQQSTTSDNFMMYQINDDLKVFPPNSLIAFNVTGARLYGQIVNEQFILDQGPSRLFSLAPYIEKEVSIGFVVETREGPRMVFGNSLEFSRNNRIILLLLPPKRKGSLRIQVFSILEYCSEEEAEAR